MDRLSQADAVIAAALAHSPTVIVPGRVLSPMDCDTTIPVTRTVVRSCDLRAHTAADARPAESLPPVAGDSLPPATGDSLSPTAGDGMLDAEMLRVSQGREPGRGAQRLA